MKILSLGVSVLFVAGAGTSAFAKKKASSSFSVSVVDSDERVQLVAGTQSRLSVRVKGPSVLRSAAELTLVGLPPGVNVQKSSTELGFDLVLQATDLVTTSSSSVDVVVRSDGGRTQSSSFDLQVNGLTPNTALAPAAPSSTTQDAFQLSIDPPNVSVVAGGESRHAVFVQSSDNRNRRVRFSANGLPAGVTASFIPESGRYGTIVVLSTSLSTDPGVSTVQILGTTRDSSASIDISLEILSNGASPSATTTPTTTPPPTTPATTPPPTTPATPSTTFATTTIPSPAPAAPTTTVAAPTTVATKPPTTVTTPPTTLPTPTTAAPPITVAPPQTTLPAPPTVAPTTTPAPVPTAPPVISGTMGTKPTQSTTGPRGTLAAMSGGGLAGSFSNVRITGGITPTGPLTLTDCWIDGNITIYSFPITLDHCYVNGYIGLVTDNTDPNRSMLTARFTRFDGPSDNDTMHLGANVWNDNSKFLNTVIEDSIIYSPYVPSPGDHADVIQFGGGRNSVFRRVVISMRNQVFDSSLTNYLNNGTQNTGVVFDSLWIEGGPMGFVLGGPMTINNCMLARSTAHYGYIYPDGDGNTANDPQLSKCVDDAGTAIK